MLKIHFPWEKLHSSVGFSPALLGSVLPLSLLGGVGLCQTSKPISEAELLLSKVLTIMEFHDSIIFMQIKSRGSTRLNFFISRELRIRS